MARYNRWQNRSNYDAAGKPPISSARPGDTDLALMTD
jgi:hypothetical protein